MNRKSPILVAGLALGLLYLVEAIIATGIFFAIWPILGGIFAAGLARRASPASFSAGTGARAGAGAGLVGGLVLIIAGTPLTLYLLGKLNEEPGFFGQTLDLGRLPSLLIMFAAYALFGIVGAGAAGGLTGLLRGGSSPRRE